VVFSNITDYDGNLSELEAKLRELEKDHDALNTEKSKMDSLIQSYKQQLEGITWLKEEVL
jgi:peptidoglycan hydrolase CwlO-like protein